MLLFCLLTTAIVALTSLLYQRYRFAKNVNQVPGFCGSVFGFGIRSMFALSRITLAASNAGLEEMTFRFVQASLLVAPAGIYRIWFGPIPHVLLSSPEMVAAVLTSPDVIRKGISYAFMTDMIGDGLLTGHGEKWRRHRKLLTHAFHFKTLGEFLPDINRCGQILTDKLEELASKNAGIINELQRPVMNCALDVICVTAMGLSVNAQSDPENEYVRGAHRASEIFMERTWKPWAYFDALFKLTRLGSEWSRIRTTMLAFTDSVIAQRKAEVRKQIEEESETASGSPRKRREPFMDILIREHLKHPTTFTERDVQDEVQTFMAAGHDTTGVAVVWATYLLGLHPEMQEKLHIEIDRIFDARDPEQDISLDELKNELPYCEAIVKESLRLFPPAALNTRTTEKEISIGHYKVPAGVQIAICTASVHRDPSHWPDPEKFDPNRFMHFQKRHPFAFVPFSAGPRNCIGQKFALLEEKALLVKLFRKFRFISLDPRDKTIPVVAFMLKPEIPVRVRLELRSHKQVTHL